MTKDIAARAQAPGLTAPAQVADYLRSEIRAGRLEGGTQIIAAAVAEKLNLSRMPVREAIQQLASEGLLTVRSNRSAVVTTLGPTEIDELYEMRAALEGYAMRHVAATIDDKGLQEAELALIRLDRARSDVDWFVSAHDIFHDVLLAYCPRRQMVDEVRRIRHATEPCLRLNLQNGSAVIANTTAEHRDLLDAVRSRDPDRAEQETRRHMLRFDVRSLIVAAPGG